MTPEIEHAVAHLRRGRMHYAAAGQGAGLVLLHGWPGFWFDYRHVLAPAAALGRVVAPDFFGFGESSALSGDPVEAADEDAFAEDVGELIESLDLSPVVFVGHDIGSAVAPALARRAPDLVRGLVLLNPTHPQIGDKRYTPGAQRETWYQHFHLLPLAARLLDGDRHNVGLYLAHFYEDWAGHTRIEPEELELVVDVYSRPGAFTSSIAWYRARAAPGGRGDAPAAVEIPTIALWGDRDPMRPLEHREGRAHLPPRRKPRPPRSRALRPRRSAGRHRRRDRCAPLVGRRSSPLPTKPVDPARHPQPWIRYAGRWDRGAAHVRRAQRQHPSCGRAVHQSAP